MTLKKEFERLLSHISLEKVLMDRFRDDWNYGGILTPSDETYTCPVCNGFYGKSGLQEHCKKSTIKIEEHMVLSIHGL